VGGHRVRDRYVGQECVVVVRRTRKYIKSQ